MINNLDLIVQRAKNRGEFKIRILSAACSRGQEVYSLAMFFRYHLQNYPGMSFEIIGTDIDPESVKIAQNGVYPFSEVKSIPQVYLSGNWQRGTGDISHFAKVKDVIRKHCSFKTMNLFQIDEVLRNQLFDIIFCRNVFIYFSMEDIERIVGNFKKYLHPHALFITGLSESLKAIDITKETLSPSVYCFDIEDEKKEQVKNIISPMEKSSLSTIPDPIRVLVVDDSSSVIKLMTKIFSEDSSFELVGTATNGLEAEVFLKNNKIDAMTLDIHMPEMNGVEYLKKNFKSGHPHVVVVSSASREDSRYAQEALKNGASDFVEKPALNNLQEKAEEIKNKIKMSFINSAISDFSFEKSFSKSFQIKDCNQQARFIVASFSDRKKLSSILSELEGAQPPLFVFLEGSSSFFEVLKTDLSSSKKIVIYDNECEIKSDHIYLCDFKEYFNLLVQKISPIKISLSILGIVSKTVEKFLLENTFGQVLIEDTDSINTEIKEIATDIFPWTSFAHLGSEFLAKEK